MPLAFYIYNVAIGIGLLLSWPLLGVWALCVPKVRAGFWQKLGHYPPELRHKLSQAQQSNLPVIWLHAVSVGEFNALRPLIIQLHEAGIFTAITTTTLTGQALAQQVVGHHAQAAVLYCPYDILWAVKAAYRLIQPQLVVIAETELWPNLIHHAQQTHSKCVIINGRLSDNSYRGYQRWLGWLVKPMLQQCQWVLAQSVEDAQRYQALGAPHVEAFGNIKLDLPRTTDTEKLSALQQCLHWQPESPCLLLASSHPGEEALFIPLFQQFLSENPGGRVIVVPRHPERALQVESELSQALLPGISIQRRSNATVETPLSASVVVVDTIGELSTLYRLATVALMGGSFLPKRGGQNPLEALAAEVPVIHGPYMRNFRTIVALLQTYKAAIATASAEEASNTALALLKDSNRCAKLVQAGIQLLDENQGATQHTVERLLALLHPKTTVKTAP